MRATWPTMPSESAASNDHAGAKSLSTAIHLYDRTFGDGWRGRIWSALRRRPSQLGSLAQATGAAATFDRHDVGVQTVSIRHIRGSEGRCRDFDADFHPLQARTRDRWLSIASMRLQGVTTPPVELICVDEAYFVRDGHHRLSVARALGEEFIEAHVTVWTSKRQVSEQPWQKTCASLSWTISAAHARA